MINTLFLYLLRAVSHISGIMVGLGCFSFAFNAWAQATGPLRVHPTNPRYFTDGSGKAIYLTGSHTWLNLQDGVISDPPPLFNYTKWLDFLSSHNHNFFRLYVWEQTKWVVESSHEYYFTPHPHKRTGPGVALDGKPKFDLTQFNQDYFDRMRSHVIQAGQRGIYVSIMLFNGWSIEKAKGSFNLNNPWKGHPFNKNNNINGIDGDPNNDNSGPEIHTLQIPAVTAIQEAYIRKVIDTVNDLDNVLYEISNESHSNSQDWQYHIINYIKSYEAGKPKQHPVGMTVEWPEGNNSKLFASPADWISPNGDIDNPPVADGRKVILSDTDHLCGTCGDRKWVWKSFTRGENPIFMDRYDDGYLLNRGVYDPQNPNDVSLRKNMGYTRTYANKMNLAAMTPQDSLASTGYCLANPVASGAEYLVYNPGNGSFTVDLTAASGQLHVEWFNPNNGMAISQGMISVGSVRTFTPPFPGDAALHLYSNSLTGVSGESWNIPNRFQLQQNYPNPFNAATTVIYSLAASDFVRLMVFNTAAQEVATLVNERQSAGNYSVLFEADKLSSGVYIYSLQVNDFVDIKKMVLLR